MALVAFHLALRPTKAAAQTLFPAKTKHAQDDRQSAPGTGASRYPSRLLPAGIRSFLRRYPPQRKELRERD